MKINLTILILFILFALLISSCGYTLQGGGRLPGGIKTVSVFIFKNRSSQTAAEIIFTNALIEEIMKSSSVKVVDSVGLAEQGNNVNQDTNNKKNNNQQINEADAVIHGTIVSISFDALARTSDDVVYKRGVNAVVNLEMKSRNGEVLFSLTNFTESESYAVSHENSIDETVVKSTLEKVASRLARRVVGQMTDNF